MRNAAVSHNIKSHNVALCMGTQLLPSAPKRRTGWSEPLPSHQTSSRNLHARRRSRRIVNNKAKDLYFDSKFPSYRSSILLIRSHSTCEVAIDARSSLPFRRMQAAAILGGTP